MQSVLQDHQNQADQYDRRCRKGLLSHKQEERSLNSAASICRRELRSVESTTVLCLQCADRRAVRPSPSEPAAFLGKGPGGSCSVFESGGSCQIAYYSDFPRYHCLGKNVTLHAVAKANAYKK